MICVYTMYTLFFSEYGTSVYSALWAVFGIDALYKLMFYILTYYCGVTGLCADCGIFTGAEVARSVKVLLAAWKS